MQVSDTKRLRALEAHSRLGRGVAERASNIQVRQDGDGMEQRRWINGGPSWPQWSYGCSPRVSERRVRLTSVPQ